MITLVCWWQMATAINAVAAAALRCWCAHGVVPMGTFNYFSRERLALDAEAAVLRCWRPRAGELRPVQVGFVNDRVFLVNASVGLYPVCWQSASRPRASWAARAVAMPLRCGACCALGGGAGAWWCAPPGTEMQEQEHEVTTLFVGNNPLQLEQVGLAQAESVAQGGLLAVVLLKPKAAGPWLARYGAPPPASWRATRPCKAWPVPS
jgi:hypothetical protein